MALSRSKRRGKGKEKEGNDAAMKVSIAQARRELTRLIRRVESGEEEEVVITKRGRPTAALLPYEQYERLLKLQADLQLERWLEAPERRERLRTIRACDLHEKARAQREERPLPRGARNS